MGSPLQTLGAFEKCGKERSKAGSDSNVERSGRRYDPEYAIICPSAQAFWCFSIALRGFFDT